MKILAIAVVVASAFVISGCASRRTVCAPAAPQPVYSQMPPPVAPPPMRSYPLEK
jgi:hypothetical protein